MKTTTVRVYIKTSFGRALVALVHAVSIETEPEDSSPYCTTFRTRLMGSGSGEWTTIWSDTVSWEVTA